MVVAGWIFVRRFPINMKSVDTNHAGAPGFENGLVGAEKLLETIFPDERDRPSLRTLRKWTALRLIPYRKGPGRMVRFSVPEVRAALDRNFTVHAK